MSMKSHYADKAQEDLNLPLNIHVAFNLKNTATSRLLLTPVSCSKLLFLFRV